MLTPAWEQLEFHPQQDAAYRTTARFVILRCGRGSGKTDLARRRTVRYLPVRKQWSNPIYVYALPTYQQAKRIAWTNLKALIPPAWIRTCHETDLHIVTKYGSELWVAGMDRPQRIEGMQIDGAVLDESSDQKPGTFERTMLPMLTHRQGWCWRIGVSKRNGVGAEDFKKAFKRGLEGKSLIEGEPSLRVESYTWSTESLDMLPKIRAELEFARANMTKEDYDEQYGGLDQKNEGAVFYAYDDVLNTGDDIAYNPNLPLCIGSDFNVNPMAWCIGHTFQNRIDVFDEIWKRNTSTQQTLDILHAKYGQHKAGFEFYGDATGRARRSSASTAAQSDYLLIRGDTRFKDAEVFYPKSNPAVVDRFAETNALCCNANNERRLRIHLRCENLRRDLQARTYIEGTREPDDKGDIGHMTDALGYWIHRRFPLEFENLHSPAVAMTR